MIILRFVRKVKRYPRGVQVTTEVTSIQMTLLTIAISTSPRVSNCNFNDKTEVLMSM